MAKKITTVGRKTLSMLLALTMVLSMLQVSVFAANGSADQIMDGYYTVDSSNTSAKAPAGTTSVTEDGYTLTKTIAPTNKENEFEITLKVETSQTVTTSHSKAATVLVIDLSNSMNYNLSQNTTRMAKAKEVAKDFLKSYAGTDASAEQYISVVWFGTTGGVDKDWVNVAGGKDCNSYNDIYNYLDTLKAPHGNQWSGGTNLERGLYEALQQLNDRSGIPEQKNVVLLTDGKPTYRGTADNSVAGDGQNGSADNNSKAAAQATAIKNTGATLYTVCIAAETDECYSGTSITVCEHCNKTQDQHIRVELCRNCGKAQSEHIQRSWKGHTYYACSNSGNTEYYNGRTYYYCNESKTDQYEAKTISNGSVTVGYFLSNDIATSADHAYNASTTEALEAALKAIASKIESSGVTGEGTTVTDPMGAYINLNLDPSKESELAAEGVSVNGETISWELDVDKAQTSTSEDKMTTTYTYTITYPIKLDTSAEGFEEGKYYPTNGYTYLSVPQADGSAKKIAFLVPGVKGTIPEYGWTVEYYLEDESSINKTAEEKTYTLAKSEAMGTADLHSQVTPPEGYATKYPGYTNVGGKNTVMTIVADSSQNVMKLYYNLDVAQVTVKHFYKTTTITPAGETVVGEYKEASDKTSIVSAVLGSTYTASEQPIHGGVNYTFDKADPADKSITVSKEGVNLIQLYYSRTDDQRKETTAQVDHVYETYTYQINPATGKYDAEPVLDSSVTVEKVQYSEDLRATTVYDVSAESTKTDYAINTEKGDYAALVMAGGKLGFVLTENAADNIRTLYFKKIVDNREEIKVTVNHYYTKNITVIEDGVVKSYNDPDGVRGSTTNYPAYKGESLTVSEFNVYKEETYNSDEGNAAKRTIDELTGDVTIDLHYNLSVAPNLADAKATHIWRTFTNVTVEVKDADGKVTGTKVETRETIDRTEKTTATGLYQGQKHTESPMAAGEGYAYNDDASDVVAYAGTGNEAVLYYDKYATADERSDATVTVKHNYVTNLETIEGGEVKTKKVEDGSETEAAVACKAGDVFTANEKLTYDGNTYTRITADAALTLTVQPGANNTIVINYEREASDLVSTNYAVNYEYRTYTMTIKDGVAGYHNAPAVTTDAVSGSGYVGQKITLDPKAQDGFALVQGDATTQYLKKEGNSYTFIYEQYNPLDLGSVTVNHHYKTITIAKNGTSSEFTQDVPGTAVTTEYIGEDYTALANDLDGTFRQTGVKVDAAAVELAAAVTVTVGENTVIDFYYEKTDDFRVPVTYSIKHEYYTYDWNGTLLNASKPDAVTGTGFATHPLVVAPEYNDYTLTSATYNGADLGALAEGETSYTVTLKEDTNEVVFVYEKRLARDYCDVTVIHNYYKDAAALAENATPEYQDTAVFQQQAEDSKFTAATRDKEGYSFYSADPESMSITVDDEGNNVIVINYIRKAASYEVIHIYQRNGVEEDRTSEQFTGLHGDVIDSESIARVETYNGNTYTFVSVSEDITLDSGAEELPVITITYNRTVYVPPYNPPVVNPPAGDEEFEEPDVPLAGGPEEEFGDEDVPLAGAPEEEEMFEEDVPLADVPATGDMTALWAAASVISAAGVLFLGKKSKDEE